MSFKGFATEMVPLQEPDANLGGFLRCAAAQSAASRLSGAGVKPAGGSAAACHSIDLLLHETRCSSLPAACWPPVQDCWLPSSPTCYCSTPGLSGGSGADCEGPLLAGSLQTASNLLAAPVNAC